MEKRTLVIEGGATNESAALALRGDRLEVDFGSDGSTAFAIARHRFDRIRTDLGDGTSAASPAATARPTA